MVPRFWFICAILALSFGGASAQPAPKWDWQLSEPIRPPQGIAIFDTDPDSVTRSEIMALNEAGVYTICYVSVGTAETYRDDVKLFPQAVIGKRYDEWPDEFFLDIRERNVISVIIQQRFLACALKGFQAIEPDNMDVYQNDSGFDITREDTLAYLRMLVRAAHNVNLEIGQKNVPELTGELVGMMDFVITEDCFNDGWCGEVLPYIAAGKPVLAAEYTDTGVDWGAACVFARANNFSMILKDRDLNAGMQTCP
ncbi:MAG: endo alpha-1,4 polygalactosaminidase [Rhodobacteraceae bacterium]|nr:endo alpha-1,4 polygalactosaminidase [Paracoccaceae bacterium]